MYYILLSLCLSISLGHDSSLIDASTCDRLVKHTQNHCAVPLNLLHVQDTVNLDFSPRSSYDLNELIKRSIFLVFLLLLFGLFFIYFIT